MKYLQTLTKYAAAALACAALFGVPAAAQDSGNLLAVKNLAEKWTTAGNWVLDETGVVSLKPREGEKGWTRYDSYLWLKDANYEDFEIEFEYKVEKGSNSGFYFHVGDVKSPVATGIEVQLYDSAGKKADAKLTDHDSGGIIPGFALTKNAAKPAGEWNKFVVTSKGDKVTVMLNGEVVNEVALSHDKFKGRPKTGGIGFQDHGLPISLQNIKIKKI